MESEERWRQDAAVAAWIDDMAELEQATEHILAMGHAAIGPLIAYLDRGPQLVSQPRVFAVRMLARLHDPRTTDRLRQLLHDNPLHEMSAELAESEYRIKDAALEALVAQHKLLAADDVTFGVCSERLPSAVRAAGALRLHALVPALAALLTDDVLADIALTALHAMRPDSVPGMLAALGGWLSAGTDTPRTRLAIIRAFRWLAEAGIAPGSVLQERALAHACLPVRSAAALAAPVTDVSEVIVGALAQGALGTDGRLAMDCRQRLQGMQQPIEPILYAWSTSAEADLYGNAHVPSPWARRQLLSILLEQAHSDAQRLALILREVPPVELADALIHWQQPAIPWLQAMLGHHDPQLRLAAVTVLQRVPASEREGWLVARLGDRDRHVRRTSHAVLAVLIDTRQCRLNLADLTLSALWRSPRACLTLLARSTQASRH